MVDKQFAKLKKIRTRGPLAEKVYSILKDAIIHGVFEQGMWLQEEALTKALGVSRTPLREALNRLKSERIIEVLPRKGAYIIELTDSDLDDLFEAREMIETIFFIRSARNISHGIVRTFQDSMQEYEKSMKRYAGDPEKWDEERRKYLQIDRALHDSLIKAGGNRYWERLYFDMRDRIEICGNQLSMDQEWFDVAIRDHYAIIECILNKEYEKGVEALRLHIQNVKNGIIRIKESRTSRV